MLITVQPIISWQLSLAQLSPNLLLCIISRQYIIIIVYNINYYFEEHQQSTRIALNTAPTQHQIITVFSTLKPHNHRK